MRSWQRQRWPTDTPTFHILIACANIYFHTIYFHWKLNRKTHFESCNKALMGLLFQPRTVYSFLKLQLLKTEGDNSRVLGREWSHWKGRSCDSTPAQRCTALRLSGSGHSKFSALIVPLESQGNSRWTVCCPHMQVKMNVLCHYETSLRVNRCQPVCHPPLTSFHIAPNWLNEFVNKSIQMHDEPGVMSPRASFQLVFASD